MRHIYEIPTEEIESLYSKSYSSKQVSQWLYEKKCGSFDEMSNLSLMDRQKMKDHYLLGTLSIEKSEVSKKDRTSKFLFKTKDEYFIEAVLIDNQKGDYTLCLSSQVGCSFNCQFCATGRLNYGRDLYPHEIVEQYQKLDLYCEHKIKNIVFMGMGEPFAIGKSLYNSLDILLNKKKFALSPRRLSISTIGMLQGIKELAQYSKKINLLISLHSARQEVRDILMPNMKKQPLVELKKALLNYQKITKEPIFLEYIMIADVNDQTIDAEHLVKFTRGLRTKINLIAYNHIGDNDFRPSPKEQIDFYRKYLENKGLIVTQRYKKGDDIQAACGQLAGR